MVKKTENNKIEKVTKYRTSDFMEFDTLKAAEEHEKDLKNPYYIMYKDKCKELKEIKEKLSQEEREIELLNKRIENLQKDLLKGPDRFPTQLPQTDPWQQPHIKFDEYGKKLPAEPGQVVYDTKPKQIDWTSIQKPETIYFGEKHQDCSPVQDGHADVGPTYTPYNPIELDKYSDEELAEMGYRVVYAGHKRAICPPIPHIDLDSIKINSEDKK